MCLWYRSAPAELIPWAGLETRREETALAEALAVMKPGCVSASMVFMEQLAIKCLRTTNLPGMYKECQVEEISWIMYIHVNNSLQLSLVNFYSLLNM